MIENIIIYTMMIVLCISLFFNYKFVKMIFIIEDKLEVAIDILDERYKSISRLLAIPIFLDSPEIRNAISDIKVARSAILYVANIMTKEQMEKDSEQEKRD